MALSHKAEGSIETSSFDLLNLKFRSAYLVSTNILL